MSIEVMVVDDHPIVRAGLIGLLDAAPDVDVVAEAASGEEALATWPLRRPPVVLMDLRLGEGIDGVETTSRLLAADGAPRVLILTTYDTDADILRAIEAGASGYLLKDAPPARIVAAVHEVAAGRTVLAPVVAQRLAARRSGNELSAREMEVLARVGAGESNRQIATALFVSEATVKTHLSHIFTKLDVDSRTAAVARARELGIIG
ncbi:response regulator [Acidipropionibacterium timonense]|uniref:response regulator n=1 Tax=Acidipropionibacterium timonense TaxID=2161818 RepID=UPI00247828E6|nr:response regulator transcription factor [Acidipropionibacterium timonense]